LSHIFTAGAFGLLGILFHFLFSRHVVRVKLGSQKIKLLDFEAEDANINWTEVASISRLWFISPPVYKLKVKGEHGYYFFTSQSGAFTTSDSFSDDTSMGALIERKKRELNI